jgi:hypothetical protein
MCLEGHVKNTSPFHFTIKLYSGGKQNFNCWGKHEDRLQARDLGKLPFITKIRSIYSELLSSTLLKKLSKEI